MRRDPRDYTWGGDRLVDFVKVGERLVKYRQRAGLSQEELAARLYVTRQALSKWERGASVPSVDTLCEITRIFSVSFEELLGLFDGESLHLDKNDIFRGHERSFVVEKIASGESDAVLHEIFHQLSLRERMYILRRVRDGALKCDAAALYACLIPHEQRYLGEIIPRLTQGDEQ